MVFPYLGLGCLRVAIESYGPSQVCQNKMTVPVLAICLASSDTVSCVFLAAMCLT